MIDGYKSGLGLKRSELDINEFSTELSDCDYTYLQQVFLKLRNVHQTKNTLSVKLAMSGTLARLTLNQWKGKPYLNVEGNPISFITGQNVVGTTNLVLLITKFYKKLMGAIKRQVPEFKTPKSVVLAVRDLDIYVHGLAFAAYTNPLEINGRDGLKLFLDFLDHCYSFANPMYEKTTVKEHLGLRVVREGPTSIRFDRFTRKNRYWSLAIYDKVQQLLDTGQDSAKGWEQSVYLKDRFRVDLTLHSEWFRKNHLLKLRDIHTKHGNDYHQWAMTLLHKVLDETKVPYVMAVSTDFIDPGKYKKWFKRFISEGAPVPSMACREWFIQQGLNVDYGSDFHALISYAKRSFYIDGQDMRLAAFGDHAAQKRIARHFENPALDLFQTRAHLFSLDYNFGRFTRVDGKVVDILTNKEVGELK